jgi:hypothetical protein
MRRGKGKFLLVLSIFTLGGQSFASAEPVEFQERVMGVETAATPQGDDRSYRLKDISVLFNGVVYENVYASTNNIISFGVRNTSCCGLPGNEEDGYDNLVAMNYADWTIDHEYGAQANEFMEADLVGEILTITTSSVPYDAAEDFEEQVSPTVTIMMIDGIGGNREVTFSFTVNGVPGSDYSMSEPYSFAQFANGVRIPLNSRSTRGINRLEASIMPTLKQSGSSLQCVSGGYKYLNGGTSEQTSTLDSIVYTLVIDGKVASQVSAGKSSGIHSSFFATETLSVKGTANMTSATFDISGLSDFSASCQIYAVQGNANLQSTSNVIDDSVKLSKVAAKAQAWEDQRATSTAANFTAEAREMRKRIAARAGNK